MTSQTVPITLSEEELAFVLLQIDAPGALGIDGAQLAGADDERQQQLLAAAQRALLARGMLALDADRSLVLDATVRAAVHAAAFAHASLALHRRVADERQVASYLLHHAEPLWVEHTQPAHGIHRFELSPSQPEAVERLAEMLGVSHQQALDADAFTLDSQVFAQIIVLETSDDMRRALVEVADTDEVTAAGFAELLAGPHQATLLQIVHRRDATAAEQTTATILHNQRGFWICEPVSATALGCRPVSADDLRTLLVTLVDRL